MLSYFIRNVALASTLSHRVRRALRISILPLVCLPAFAAESDVVMLDRLVVSTATRTQRLLAETPVRTEVLLSDNINMRGAANLSQAIELVNGIRIESNCQNCNTTEVQLLGLGGAYNQLLFDGTPLLSALGGVYGLEQIPAAFIDRLEIVKGGGSALYGPDAVAGVINLIPAIPIAPGGFIQSGVEIQKNTPLYITDARADVIAASGKLAISFVGQYARNNGIDFNNDGYSEITEKRLAIGGFMAIFRPSPLTTLHTYYQYIHETRRGGNRLEQPEYLANIAESLRTGYHRGMFTWAQEISSGFNFRANYSFVHIDRKSFYGGLGDIVTDPNAPGFDPAQLDPSVPGSAASASYNQYGATKNPLHYIDLQTNLLYGAHAIAFGAQYKHEAVRDENRDYTGNILHVASDDVFSNTGIFVQDEWTVSSRINLVLGARADKSSSLDSIAFSPRIAVAADLTPALKLRAAISTGFRAPEVFSEDLHVETLGSDQIRIRNATGLRKERAATYMTGLEWRPVSSRQWAVDLTASYTDIRDTFALGEIQTDPGGTLYQERFNASGSRIAGLELNVSGRPVSQLVLIAGAAYYHSEYNDERTVFDDTSDGGTIVIATRRYLKTPDWTAVAQAVWTPVKTLDVIAGLKYTGPMRALNNSDAELRRTRDFWVLDLGLTRHFSVGGSRHFDVSIGVKNLLDQRQKDLETGANRDSTYVYGPRYARSFYVTMRYEF